MEKQLELTAMITGLNVLLAEANELKNKCMEEGDYAGLDNVQKRINIMYAKKMQCEKELEPKFDA